MFNLKEIVYEYHYDVIGNQLVRFNKDMMIFQVYNWKDKNWRSDTLAFDVAFWTTERFFGKISESKAEQIIKDFYKNEENNV